MAANAELNLVIGVVDKASSGLGKIAGGLATLGKIGAGAVLGGAVAGVGALSAALVGGISDARDAAIVFAQTESAIKATGGAAGVSAQHVSDYAASLSAASGQSLFGDDQIQESTNLLLTFKEIKGATLDAATAISVDMAQALGGAPADSAVQLGKALNDPIAGISALSRVGVTFSDEQKKMIKTMQEHGDMAGAQGVILKELQGEFGGSAAAAAAADGGFTQFKDRMGELAESVGAKVLPALNGLMGWLNSPDVQSGISTIVDGLVNGLGAAFTWISETAMPVLQSAFQTVWPIIQQAVAAFSDWFMGTVWPALQSGFTWLSETALPALQAAFQTVWPIIQQAVDTAYQFFVTTVWPWLETAFAWVKDTGLPAIQTAFETVWPVIMAAVQTVYAFFKDVVWPWLQTAFALLKDTVLPSLQAAFNEVWPKIQAAVKAVFDWLHDTFFPWLQNTAFPWLADVALPAVKLAFEVAWAAISTAVKTVYTFLRDTVWPWLQNTAFPWLTDTALPAVQKAFETVWPLIKTAVENVYNFLLNTVWPWLKTAFEDVKTWVGEVQTRWDTAWAAIGTAVDTAKGVISGAIATIKSLVDGAITQINNLISLINNIPGVNIPSIPSIGGGGGLSQKSFGGSGLQTQSIASSHTTYIDARGASDPRGIEAAVDRAMRAAGVRTDLRLRTT